MVEKKKKIRHAMLSNPTEGQIVPAVINPFSADVMVTT